MTATALPVYLSTHEGALGRLTRNRFVIGQHSATAAQKREIGLRFARLCLVVHLFRPEPPFWLVPERNNDFVTVEARGLWRVATEYGAAELLLRAFSAGIAVSPLAPARGMTLNVRKMFSSKQTDAFGLRYRNEDGATDELLELINRVPGLQVERHAAELSLVLRGGEAARAAGRLLVLGYMAGAGVERPGVFAEVTVRGPRA